MSTAIDIRRASVRPQSPLARLGWALADAWTIARRDLAHWRLRPGAMLLGWFFPVMTAVMFGSLFGGAIAMPSGVSYYQFLMPGMFTLAMFFGLEGTMVAITTDAAKGVTDRFRSLPISAVAVVLGRCIADMLNAAVGLAVLIGAGLLLGWRPAGLGGLAAAAGLLLLLRFALLWLGIYLGLVVKSPEAVVSVQILVWPISFLSSVFVDPATMPRWLGTIAEWNPLSATAAATRALFGADGAWPAHSWVASHAPLMALIWPALLTAIFLPLAARAYRRLSR